MAPEQFDGMLSKRSDQYALACIAYEMLTGRNPFRGPSAVAMALKHKTEIPVAPTQFNTYLPVSLRSEEHTSELQSHLNLVCRLLLEKKKKKSEHTQDLVEC